MGWSISTPPGIEPATIDGSGNATFKKNTGNSVVYYTVTYTDDDGTKCVAKVKQKGNPCTYVYTKNTENIPVEGGRYVFGTLSNVQGQSMTVEVTHGKTYINPYPPGDITINGDNQLVANVFKNTGGTRDIKYKIYANNMDCGAGEHTNTQDPNDCSCNKLTASTTSLSWTWDNTDAKYVTIKYPSCITNIRITSTLSYFTASISTVETGEDKITITPNDTNTSTTPNTDTIVITYDAGTIEGCTKSISLTQNVNGCACRDLTVSPTSLTWDWDSTTPKPVTLTVDPCISSDDITVRSTSTEFSVSRNGNTININPTSTTVDARDAQVIVSYKAGFNSCSSAISVHQDAKGCACDCKYIKAVNNEEGRPFYIYPISQDLEADPPQPLTNVPFVILTASTAFECNDSDIETQIVYGDIRSIDCVEYDNSDTRWNGGWKDSYYQDFRQYCSRLSQSGRVFIIYGTLKEITSSEPTVYGIRYKVCNNTCEDGRILRIFQRCACGMDNCRNEYTPTSTERVVEDNPLYINSCPTGYQWYHGDSICVHKLTVTGARVYKIDSRTGEKVGAPIVSSSYTASDNTYVLRNDTIAWDYSDPAICQGWFGDCSNWGTYMGNYWVQGKEINPKYIQWPKDTWVEETPGKTYIDHTRTLHLIEHTGSSVAEEDKIQLEIMISPNGIDHETPDECPIPGSYEVRAAGGGPGQTWLGKGMIQYEINAPVRNYERLIEVDYHTGVGEKMTAGQYEGRCALLDFTITIYIAPHGWRYDKDDVDDKYKGKMYQC